MTIFETIWQYLTIYNENLQYETIYMTNFENILENVKILYLLNLAIFDNISQFVTKFDIIWKCLKISYNLSILDNIWQKWTQLYKV